MFELTAVTYIYRVRIPGDKVTILMKQSSEFGGTDLLIMSVVNLHMYIQKKKKGSKAK